MTALMFCNPAIAFVGAAIVSVVATPPSYGAPAAFSDDGNHVYLLGSKLPKGTALDIDLTDLTAKKLNLGVSTDVRGIANAPRATSGKAALSHHQNPNCQSRSKRSVSGL